MTSEDTKLVAIDGNDALAAVLDAVAAERGRQDNQWGEQNHPDGTAADFTARAMRDSARVVCESKAKRGALTWADVLDEEYWEARAETDPARLRAELVQVAAVAVAWIEAIDRRTGARPALLEAVAEQLPADAPQRAADTLAAMPGPPSAAEDTTGELRS